MTVNGPSRLETPKKSCWSEEDGPFPVVIVTMADGRSIVAG